jgi:hypothetical protein
VSYVFGDRVRETTATTGTSTINLAGAVSGYQTFIGVVGSGNNCNYLLQSGDGVNWEVGIGLVTSGTPNTLTRQIVLASSNSNSLISLSGTSTVLIPPTASQWASRICAPIVPPVAAASWTARNSAAITNVSNGVQITDTAQTAVNLRMASRAAPATPYTIDANFSFLGLTTNGNNANFGLGWTNGTASQMLAIATQAPASIGGSGQTIWANIQNFSNFTTQASTSNLFYIPTGISPGDAWLRIADDGTNVSALMSVDGVTFVAIMPATAKSGAYLGASGYTNVGFFLDAIGGSGGPSQYVTLRSWWQH